MAAAQVWHSVGATRWPFPDDGVCACVTVNHYSLYVGLLAGTRFECFDFIFVDGGLLARQLSKLTNAPIPRVTFDLSSVAREWIDEALKRDVHLLFVGGRESHAKSFEAWLHAAFPQRSRERCVVRDGYADFDARSVASGLDPARRYFIVFGTGTPKQEKQVIEMADAMRDAGISGTVFTCGGFITQTALASKRGGHFYPSWVRRCGLRWLYRIMTQPYVIGRLIRVYPRSIVMVHRARVG